MHVERVPSSMNESAAMSAREYPFDHSFCRVCGDSDAHPLWQSHGARVPDSRFYMHYCKSPDGTVWTTVCSGCELALAITALLEHERRHGPGDIQRDVKAFMRLYWERKLEPAPPPPSPPSLPATVGSGSTSLSSVAQGRAYEEVIQTSASESSRTSVTRPPSYGQTSSGSGSGSQGSWGTTSWGLSGNGSWQ